MRKKLLIACGVLATMLLVFVIIVALQPSEFRVERSMTMDAPPAVVFGQVNDLHRWDNWSPWAKLDPAAKNSFDGADAGEGAVFDWSGNDQVGEGRMTITKSLPNELVQIKLEFRRPFEDTSTAKFAFRSKDDQTTVTWSMYGEQNFIEKAICMFMDMDGMLGNDFEKGLKQLKATVESESLMSPPITTPDDSASYGRE